MIIPWPGLDWGILYNIWDRVICGLGYLCVFLLSMHISDITGETKISVYQTVTLYVRSVTLDKWSYSFELSPLALVTFLICVRYVGFPWYDVMCIIWYDDLSCKHVRELHIHKINMNILIFQVFVILKLTLFYPCLIFVKMFLIKIKWLLLLLINQTVIMCHMTISEN